MGAPLDIAAHAVRVTRADLPLERLDREDFLLDTLGVGIAGSNGANVRTMLDLAGHWGGW